MNNQSSIQIQPQATLFISINSYYSLCTELLQIDSSSLRYFPFSIQPHRQTFERLASIQIYQRQTRQEISLHLATAYYSTSLNQRQIYLQHIFVTFLSKLRQIPPNIKLLLALENTLKPIQFATKYLQNHSHQFTNNFNEISSKIITPKQIIQDCTSCIETIQKLAQSSPSSRKANQHINDKKLSQKEQIQVFFKKKQFLLDDNLSSILQWKYKACILSSLIFLSKQTKKMTVNFIKLTKSLIKAGLLQLEIAVKVYLFCLNHTFKNSSLQNHQEHVYYQLQINKILHNSQNQLSQKLLQQIQILSNQIKLNTQKSLLSNPPNHQKSIIPNKNYLPKFDSFLIPNQNDKKLPANNLHPIKKSASTHCLDSQNQLLSKFKPRFNFLLESESLNKIKQYQISLRKQKDDQNEDKKTNNKIITFRSQKQPKQTLTQNKFLTFRNKTSHQSSLILENKIEVNHKLKTNESQSESTWRKKRGSKTPSKIYLTIKDKVSKEVAITAMGLENEMFMAPEFVYEKPKITFQQILNDARSMQQRQNDSESTVFHHTVNETYLKKIQTELEYVFMMNEEFFSIKIKKLPQCTEHFLCSVVRTEYSFSRIKFQNVAQFTLKTIKNNIESTDLFFELMQANIKAFKLEPVLKLAMMINNITELQNSDQLTYYSPMTCLNTMIQIANYIQPYIYWYFTKRNKINGFILQKRQKILMTDPLKFSINLQFLKKSDFSGCVHLFQTIRNKKGLKESIIYLSQGRQILCKHLVKIGNNYFVQVASLNPKYLKRFQIIGPSMQLCFPILKIDLKKFSLTDQILSKEKVIIQKVFGKLFRKPLKRGQKKAQDENERLQRINMKNIFTNDQCNRIVINNLNKNYVEKRFIIKLINNLDQIKTQSQPDISPQNDQKFTQLNSRSQSSKERIIYQKQDHCKLQVRLGLEINPDHLNDTASALKTWIASLINKDKNKSDKPFKKSNNHHFQKQQNFTQDFTKNEIILSQRINKKLRNYHNFLAHIIQNYESSFLIYVQKEYRKNVKLNKKFYSLSVLQLSSNVYILLLHSNSNSKTWILYLSQKLLRNFDYLMFNKKNDKHSIIKSDHSHLSQQNNVHFSQQNNINFPQQNSIKIKVKPATSLESKGSIHSEPDRKEHQFNPSMKSTKSENIYQNTKINPTLFPFIYNDQSEKFQLCFFNTPFYNTIAVRRRNSDLYLTNLSSKTNPFSLSYSVNKVVMKKIIKSNFLDMNKTQFVYFACSLDQILNFWRVDIYRPSNQEKFVAFIPKCFFFKVPSCKKVEQPSEKYSVFWRKIINEKKYKIDFFERVFSLNSNKFKLYETFGQLTLPPTSFIEETYFQRIQSHHKDVHEMTLDNIQRRNNQDKTNFSVSKNSGLVQLLKNKEQVTLILLNYEKRRVYSSEIEENPTHLFANIFSEQHFKESKHIMYQSLLRRLFQKIQRNSVVLNSTNIDELGFCEE